MGPPRDALSALSQAWGRAWLIIGFVLLIAISTGLSVAKVPSWFLHPPLYCEDGLFFSYYVTHRQAYHILWIYNGYVSLLPNLIAYLAGALPASWAPHLMSGWALLIGAVSKAVFFLPRFRTLIHSDRARWLICLVLALWPIGDFAMLHAGVYSLWNLLWILILLSLVPPSDSLKTELPVFLTQVALICSHPLSIVTVPATIGWTLIRRKRVPIVLQSGLILTSVLYQWLGVERLNLPHLPAQEVLRRTFTLLMQRGLWEGLFGAKQVVQWQQSGHQSLLLWGGAALIGLFLVFAVLFAKRIGRWSLWALASLGFVMVGITALGVVSRGLEPRPELWEQRYYHIQHLCLVLMLGMLAHGLFRHYRWTLAKLSLALAPVIVWTAVLLSRQGYALWEVNPTDGARVAEFLQNVERVQSSPKDHPQSMQYSRGRWSLNLLVH